MVFFQNIQMLNSPSLFKFISQKEAENQKFCIAFRYAESKGSVIGNGSIRIGQEAFGKSKTKTAVLFLYFIRLRYLCTYEISHWHTNV